MSAFCADMRKIFFEQFCKMNLSLGEVLSHQKDEGLKDGGVPLSSTFTHMSEEKVCKMNLSLGCSVLAQKERKKERGKPT